MFFSGRVRQPPKLTSVPVSLHTIQPRELVSYAKETQTAEIQTKDEDHSDSESESKLEDKENLKPEVNQKEELENEKNENSQPHLPKARLIFITYRLQGGWL